MPLRQIAIGSISMSSVTVLRMMVQIFILPFLARYLSPADYGTIAVAMPFVLFAMMFSDAGLSASLIRKENINHKEWSTCYWFITGLGLVMALIAILIGFGLSIFLDNWLLLPIFAALSLIIPLQSLSTVPGAFIQRNHRFKTLAAIEIACMVLSLIATIISAVNGMGAWSLVVQQLTHYMTKLILTLTFARFLPSITFKLALIYDHLTFGKNLLGANFVSFIRESIKNVIFSKMFGAPAMGTISMASMFANLPAKVVSGPLQLVLYPRFSALQHDKIAIQNAFIAFSRLLSIICFPLFGMLAIAHQPVFTIILSEKWAQSGEVFMIMAPAAALHAVSSLRGTIAMAYGRTDIILRQMIEITVISLIILAIFTHFGLIISLITLSISSSLYILRSTIMILPLIELPIIQYFKCQFTAFVITVISTLIYSYVNDQYTLNNLTLFALAFIFGIFSVLIAFAFQFKKIKSSLESINWN